MEAPRDRLELMNRACAGPRPSLSHSCMRKEGAGHDDRPISVVLRGELTIGQFAAPAPTPMQQAPSRARCNVARGAREMVPGMAAPPANGSIIWLQHLTKRLMASRISGNVAVFQCAAAWDCLFFGWKRHRSRLKASAIHIRSAAVLEVVWSKATSSFH